MLHEAYYNHMALNLEKKVSGVWSGLLTLQLLTSRWQNTIMKIAVFLRNCGFHQHKSI